MAYDYFLNLKIDARGHVSEVCMADVGGDSRRWFGLDGSTISTDEGHGTRHVQALRIDARGHIVAVAAYDTSEGYIRWFDLAGTPSGSALSFTMQVEGLKLDARGHVVQVYMDDANWYDLAGEAA